MCQHKALQGSESATKTEPLSVGEVGEHNALPELGNPRDPCEPVGGLRNNSPRSNHWKKCTPRPI